MTVPAAFPVWLAKAGQPDMQANDLAGYNAAVALGWGLPAPAPASPAASAQAITPTQTIASGEVTVETDLSAAQPVDVADPGQPDVTDPQPVS